MEDDLRKPLLRSASINDGEEATSSYSSINAVENGEDDGTTYASTRFATPKEVTINSELKTKLYKRRWYILVIYSLFAGSQGLVWNTWGPISASCEEAFGWNNADISLLTNWGPISYIVSAVFFSWMIDVKGLRWACLSSMFLVAAGCGLRCFTSTPPLVTWLVHTGQFLNGLGGPAAMAAPPALSAHWFAPNERTTATAVGAVLNVMGVAVSFIVDIIYLVCWLTIMVTIVIRAIYKQLLLFPDPALPWLNHIGLFLNGLAGPAAMSGPSVVSATWFSPHQRTLSTATCFALSVVLQAVSYIIGQFLNGLAGPIAMGGPPALSAVWFGPHERATSTALSFSITNVLLGSGFFLGPLLVPDKANPNCTTGNHSVTFGEDLPNCSFNELELFDNNSCSNASKAARITKERKQIMFLMYVELGWCLAVLLAMLLYFPKKPPLPPCISASVKRESFFKGLKGLMKRGDFWIICFVYGLALGVCNCWIGVIDVNLKPHGISQNEAGWIGFYGTCAGCLGSLIMARLADIFSKNMKWIILVLYILGGGFFVWFALICKGIAPASSAMLYLTVIGGVTSLSSAVPLLFEMSCELTYPIGEGTTNGVLTLMNNIGGLVFLFVLMIPSIGTMWMNWTIIGVVAICVPVLFLLKDTYKRLELDEANTETK